MASCHDPCVDSAADAYERDIVAFLAAREAKYCSDDGWLTMEQGRAAFSVQGGGSRFARARFNRACKCRPPRAFNPLVTCPFAAACERLDVPIRAGERHPRGS
jgi:hypothetical protein